MKYVILTILVFFISSNPVQVIGQSASESFYQKNCIACHTIGGGKLIGPDLKNVLDRVDRPWLVKWILDPQAILATGDEYAQKILSESNNIPMIKSPGITEALANGILDYIQIQSDLNASSQTVQPELTFNVEDEKNGELYFTGQMHLENGGPACISCHTINSLRGLGGGRLGVDLTRVFSRLGGARALNAWLKSPPGATMIPIFSKKPLTEQENIALVAFLKAEDSKKSTVTFAAMGTFIFYGLFGSVIILILMGILGENRFRAVRKPMINNQQ